MPWAPLFSRRKQSVVIIAGMQANLLMIDEGASALLRFVFADGSFLVNTGSSAPAFSPLVEDAFEPA